MRLYLGLVARHNEMESAKLAQSSQKITYYDQPNPIYSDNFDTVGRDAPNADSGFHRSSMESVQSFQTDAMLSSGEPRSITSFNYLANTSSDSDDVFSPTNKQSECFHVADEQIATGAYWSKDISVTTERLSHTRNDTGCEIDIDVALSDVSRSDPKRICCKTISEDSGMSGEVPVATL